MNSFLGNKLEIKGLVAVLALLFVLASGANAKDIVLAHDGHSDYTIIIPLNATKAEQKAAHIFQSYFKQVCGVTLSIKTESGPTGGNSIFIGTDRNTAVYFEPMRSEREFVVATQAENLVITAQRTGTAILPAVYYFIEHYLGCSKPSNVPAIVPEKNEVTVPSILQVDVIAPFEYAEVYEPMEADDEFREWHGMDRFEALWGLWGHSFNKLVPAQVNFKTHPEYYALVHGKRQATQLCLSNEAVFQMVVAELRRRMKDDPDAKYWSVSPNDDNGYCTCEQCRAADAADGGPQGSLIKFVNRVAAEFPDKIITTLAYGYTHKPPTVTRPASNVVVFLSDIDAYRDLPLRTSGSAAGFRHDLEGWQATGARIYVWDYITEFTNYLAPFPDQNTYKDNIAYFKEHGVKGILMQGSGETYSADAPYKTFVAASLLNDPDADLAQLTNSFMTAYYGKAAQEMMQFQETMGSKLMMSHHRLDIYGNPVNEWSGYLTTDAVDRYSGLFERAYAKAEGDKELTARLVAEQLQLEYTVLQQARFFGIEPHGIFAQHGPGIWAVRPELKKKVDEFVVNCKKAGVKELSEGGLTPEQYKEEWTNIFKAGVTQNLALGATVSLAYPFAEDYPAKGNRTLVDGNPGYNDFSYNWLCFYGTPMQGTVDLGKQIKVSRVSMHFLDDPRHWIFLPASVKVELSTDGTHYTTVDEGPMKEEDEHYDIAIKPYGMELKVPQPVRYIRVTANNRASLPDWRQRENKKPMIACDEIYVQ